MEYITEQFTTKEARNDRYRQLRDEKRIGVVKYSDVERVTINDPWKSVWYVAYPPEIIRTVEEAIPQIPQMAAGPDQEMA